MNRSFGRASKGYIRLCGTLIRKSALSLILLAGIALLGGLLGYKGIPHGFLPEEDLGYMYVNVTLPNAASLQRTDAACKKIEEILRNISPAWNTTRPSSVSA